MKSNSMCIKQTLAPVICSLRFVMMTLILAMLFLPYSSSALAEIGYQLHITNQPKPVLVQEFNQQPSSRSNNILTYQNASYGFGFYYPSNWIKVNESVSTDRIPFVIFASPQTRSWLEVDLLPNLNDGINNSSISLGEFTAIVELPFLREQLGVIPTVPNSTTIDHNPANYVFYYSPESSSAIIRAWTVKDNVGYILIYTAAPSRYSSDLPTVTNMINSFHIFSPPNLSVLLGPGPGVPSGSQNNQSMSISHRSLPYLHLHP